MIKYYLHQLLIQLFKLYLHLSSKQYIKSVRQNLQAFLTILDMESKVHAPYILLHRFWQSRIKNINY